MKNPTALLALGILDAVSALDEPMANGGDVIAYAFNGAASA